jgi:leader peptidase (prepilin peptidase) / N-methyltransferase
MTVSSAIPRFSAAILPAMLAIAGWSAICAQGWLAWISCLLGWWLVALAVFDIRYLRLPDYLTLPLAPLGLIVAFAIAPSRFSEHLLGYAGGFVVFVAVAEGYRRLRRRDGLGFGDAKLMAALGAWLGWPGLPSIVLIAALSGLAVALAQTVMGRGMALDRPLPFGAYLCLGGWLVWLYGPLALH